MAQQPDTTAFSTGQVMAAADWLDVHFEAARPEYTATVRSAGFQPGWRVLDAGCGGGSFLPLLADLVGPSGQLAALDLAPENVAAVRARAAALDLAAPLEAEAGSVTVVPYPDDAFDGLWCANVTQYLTDDELVAALMEFRRVVRPGGLIAIKDSDVSLARLPSGEPGLVPRLFEALDRAGSAQAHGNLRGPELRAFLRRTGLSGAWLRTILMERWSPYSPIEREYIRTLIATFAGAAEGVELSAAEGREWARLRDRGVAVLDDPGHYYRMGDVLAVGTVPA
ncbi:MAG TPA: methyltransferase domain-containing protein [Thermomicrobiaceae bacterium]|nr:methyltransferase domain-containing protein [Thermomicrobiaceae bacterium]